MLYVAVLEALAVVATALGGAMFVIISVLPTVLPRALELARKQLQEALDDAQMHSQVMDLESIRETQESLEKLKKVGTLLQDIESALRTGLTSAMFLIISAVVAILMMLFSAYVNVNGVVYVEDTTAWDIPLSLAFVVGLIFMLISGRSFYKIIRLVVSPPKPKYHWTSTAAFTNIKANVGEMTLGSFDTGTPSESEEKEDRSS